MEHEKFLKIPNKLVQKMGKLTLTLEFKAPTNLLATCIAMESVAKAEVRDDNSRKNGTNDYTISLEKLFNAFDTFIREYTRKHKAGWIKSYNLSSPCELTIFLLWQIRNTWTHHGGLIDNKCKEKYEEILNSALEKGVKPIIDLPQNLEVGYEFTMQFDDYHSIKKCVFKYIGERVSDEDLKILSFKSSVTDIKCDKCLATIELEAGTLIIDLVEAYECGFEIDPITKKYKAPSKMEYDLLTERVILISTGKSFPAKLVKRSK